MYFSTGRFPFELAQRSSRVALASHTARSSTPLGVTSTNFHIEGESREQTVATHSCVHFQGMCVSPTHARNAEDPCPTHPLNQTRAGLALSGLLVCLPAFRCPTCSKSQLKHGPPHREMIVWEGQRFSGYHSVHFITHQSFAFY